MPADRTPAPGGHCSFAARSGPASKANKAIGTDGSSNVFQSMRHQVWVSVSPMATRKISAPLSAAGPFRMDAYVPLGGLRVRPAS